METVPDVTWRASAEEGLVFISPNIERISGYTQDEIMTTGWHGWISCIYEDDRDSVAQECANLFRKSSRRDLSYRFQCKDGSWIWLRDRAGKVYENEGKRYVDGVLSDITKLKLVELGLEQQYLHLAEVVDQRTRELRESNTKLLAEIAERQQTEEELLDTTNRLRESNAELEQFAQIASHDMKEPLMLITAFAERLEKNCGDMIDSRGREYVKRIRKASSRLQELIQALLELARVTTRAKAFEKIELQELLQDVVQNLEERVRLSGGEIRFDTGHWLQGDRTQIWQLFQNILSNALKYRQRDLAPIIEIWSNAADDDFCEITIQDNGIGFSEEDRERIFMPFFRLRQAGGYEGTGMGLATCRKIVIRHGGEIIAHGKPGKGSVFVVRLPLYRQKEFHESEAVR
ncbi:MAG: ATP-binding protein [Deltaproteobacteria bacterium]